MLEPINYMAMMPTQDAGDRFSQGLMRGAQFADINAQQQLRDQQAAALAEKQRLAEQYNVDANNLAANFSRSNLLAHLAKYPQNADKMAKVLESMDKGQKESESLLASQVMNAYASGNSELAGGVLDELIQANKQAGKSTTALEYVKNLGSTDSKAAALLAGQYLSAINPELVKTQAEAAAKQGEEARAAALHPSELDYAKVKAEGRSAFAQQLIDAGYVKGSQEFNRLMNQWNNAQIEGEKRGKGVTVINEAQKQISTGTDIAEMVNKTNKTVEPYTKALDFGDSALASIYSAIKDRNPSSWLSAQRAFVRMTDSGNISNQDMLNAGQSPEVISGIADTVNKWVEGVPTNEFMRKMADATKILQNIARNKLSESVSAQMQLAIEAGNSPEAVEKAFKMHILNANRGVKKQPAQAANQQQSSGASRPAPSGVPPDLWAEMTDKERAAWR